MRTKLFLGPMCATVVLSACSLLNSFPEVDKGDDGSAGGGGAPSSGGSAQGGEGGEASGGSSTGGVPSAEAGLIVTFGNDGVSYGAYALSPQTGEEERRIEVGEYPMGLLTAIQGAAHEAERNLWFLAKPTAIRAARFDRLERSWEFDGEDQTVDAIGDFGRLFAEDGVLVYFSTVGGATKLVAYDTTDPSSIELVDEISDPIPPMPATNQLWSASAYPVVGGLELFVLWRDCTAADPANCDVRLDRYLVNKTSITKSSTTGVLSQISTAATANRGGVLVDRFNGNVVVVLPNPVGSTGEGIIRRYSRTRFDSTGVSLERTYVQFASDMSRLALDPCTGVLAIGSPLSDLVQLVPLVSSGGTTFNWSLGSNIHSVRFEPNTRSLIVPKAIGSDTGVVAGQLDASSTEPTVQRRSANWAPPTIVPQFGAVVAEPARYVCE